MSERFQSQETPLQEPTKNFIKSWLKHRNFWRLDLLSGQKEVLQGTLLKILRGPQLRNL